MPKKKLYEILAYEPYEPHYQMLVTDNRKWAEWWCTQANKCINTMESYYISEYNYPHIYTSYDKRLYILFTFDLSNDTIFSSVISCSDHEMEEWNCYEKNYIDFLGKGESYEECEEDARRQYTKWRTRS